jgi:transposase-like protein
MSKRRRRIFSREFKLAAVERMFGGESTKALAKELRVNPNHLQQWCHRFRIGGAEAVRQAGRPRKPVVSEEEQAKTRATDLASARKYIAELEAKIGQQQVDLDFFRQALRRVREARRPSDGPGVTASTRSSKR